MSKRGREISEDEEIPLVSPATGRFIAKLVMLHGFGCVKDMRHFAHYLDRVFREWALESGEAMVPAWAILYSRTLYPVGSGECEYSTYVPSLQCMALRPQRRWHILHARLPPEEDHSVVVDIQLAEPPCLMGVFEWSSQELTMAPRIQFGHECDVIHIKEGLICRLKWTP